ncbi:MAG: translation initiation factor IF-2 N-terminal domain-containing protein, partial [Notoacmeibacter sp.]|nr:translation initiation factor IF-2 N-terminal domain-containing protein [Notoacmeibacter sp.]
MSDSKSGDDKTLHVPTKKTLTLKRSGNEQGTVRQNFSHGRSKAVVVETKKRKFSIPSERAPEAPPARPAAAQPAAPVARAPEAPRPAAPQPRPSAPSVASDLSNSEMDARRRALEDAREREAEDRARAEEDARRRAEEDARRARERAEAEKAAAEEARRLQVEAEAAQVAEEKGRVKRAPEAEAAKPVKAARAEAEDEGEDDKGRGGVKRGGPVKPEAAAPRPPARTKGDEGRRSGKLTLNRALNEDGESRGRSLSSMRRRQEKFKRSLVQEPREKIIREVVLPETISVQELAQRMAERAVDVVKFMMKQGQMIKPGDIIDADTAELIASEFGHTVKRVSESDVEDAIMNVEDKAADLKSRPPVVTIMG